MVLLIKTIGEESMLIIMVIVLAFCQCSTTIKSTGLLLLWNYCNKKRGNADVTPTVGFYAQATPLCNPHSLHIVYAIAFKKSIDFKK